MVVRNNILCPHCGRPPVEGGGATRDHIFPDAFGGQGTIVACKDCNSGIGSGVEGKLLGPESPFTLFLQGSGLPHGQLKATHPLGEFMVDLGTGDHMPRTSVEILDTDVDGVKTVKMFGSPEEITRINAGFENKYGPPLEVLSEQIGSPDAEPEVLNVSVSVDMADLRRLVAKTALCALTYLQGDSFVRTALASWLREVLDAPREWPTSVRRPPQDDPDGEGAATRTFDTAEVMTKAQAMLAKAVDPIDITEAAASLLIAIEPRYSAGPRTGFAMSLMGWILPTGLFAPGVPTDMWAPIFVIQRQREPIRITDLARGLPNGYQA
jgi:hypothetical protein